MIPVNCIFNEIMPFILPSPDFADAGEMWLGAYTEGDYNATDFKTEVEELWNVTK